MVSGPPPPARPASRGPSHNKGGNRHAGFPRATFRRLQWVPALPSLTLVTPTPIQRPRRRRRTEALRRLVREHELAPGDLIQPLFVVHGRRVEREIDSMPGVR